MRKPAPLEVETPLQLLGLASSVAGLLGAAALAYGFLEARLYRTKRYRVPVLPPGARDVTILQVSDLHLRLRRGRLRRFLDSLAAKPHDIVLATGDLLGDPEAVDECLRLLNGLEARMGRFFVFGSSDYYAPALKSYLDYFLKRRHHGTARNPTRRFREGLTAAGWKDLNNATLRIDLDGTTTDIVGMDDPWLNRDDRAVLSRTHGTFLGLVVVHDPAPFQDAVDAGFDLVVAGHTHGGQVRLPFVGAVVSNSTLPPKLARGLSRVGPGWLFVSPGLGTGRYAPFRFMCRPEASVLHLVEREGQRSAATTKRTGLHL